MSELRKIKRKDLDLKKYSKAINDALNYRIYAEYWYLDILTKEKWECWISGDYEVVMPVPLQYKFGIKFVLQPVYCQQLGVFYKDEIPDELFREFEEELHKYRVRAYHFNEENTERYNPEGEKRVNYVLDLNRPYEEIFNNYKKDKKRNLKKASTHRIELERTDEVESYFEMMAKYYPAVYARVKSQNKALLQELGKKGLLIQYILYLNGTVNNRRIFIKSNNRIYVMASARNKEGKNNIDFSTFIINEIIKEFSADNKCLDFEGSMLKGVASFNEGFGSQIKEFILFRNFSLKF